MKSPLRIVAADDERPMRDYYRELLPRLGHQAVVAEGGRQLIELCRELSPDLVITDIRMADLDGIEAAAEVSRGREVPVILVSAHHDPELQARAGQGAVMAYLVKPVKQADLETAINLAMARYEQFRALRQESAHLRQALEDRKLIERAKGILMKRLRVDEPEAFRRLRKLSADDNRKMVEVAREVVAAEDVFRHLDPG